MAEQHGGADAGARQERRDDVSCRHDFANGTCIRCYPARPEHIPVKNRRDPGPEEDYEPNLEGPGAVPATRSVTLDLDTAKRLIAELRAAHGAIRDARGLAAQQFQVDDVLDSEDVELSEEKLRALCAISDAIKPPGKFYTTSSLLKAADQLEAALAEVERLQQEASEVEVEVLVAGEADTMEIRALRAEVATLRAEVGTLRTVLAPPIEEVCEMLGGLRAEVEAMREVVLAASVFREALRDEDAECVVEHNALMSAVDAYRSRES